jgi:hypothetical protein
MLVSRVVQSLGELSSKLPGALLIVRRATEQAGAMKTLPAFLRSHHEHSCQHLNVVFSLWRTRSGLVLMREWNTGSEVVARRTLSWDKFCRSQWPSGLRHVLSSTVQHWDCGFVFRSRHGCKSSFFCVVLSCVGRGLALGWSPIQGDLPNVYRFVNSEKLNSESEQAMRPNPWRQWWWCWWDKFCN